MSTETSTTAAIDYQELAKRHLWMHFTRMGAYDRGAEIPIIVRGEGCYVWDEHGNRYLDGSRALFCVNAGHGRAEHRRGRRRPGQGARLLHELELRAPARDRARRADRLARPRRPQPRLLHLRRLARRSSRRSSSPASTTSSPATRSKTKFIAREIAYHGTTLARSRATGITGLRTPFEPLAPGGCHVAEHEQLPLARGPRPALGRRRDRGADRVRGPGDGRRGDPRAGAERRRLLRAAGRLLPARARDLRPLRRAADLRRGDLLLGPARPLLRLRSATATSPTSSRPPRALTSRLRADGRDDRLRPRRSSRSCDGHRLVRPRLHLRRPPGGRGGRAGEHRRLRATRTSAATCSRERASSARDARGAARHPDRRRRARRRLLPRDRAGQGPGDQGELQRRGVRDAAARLPLRRALPPRPDLPRRRPRRPGDPARAAADRRTPSSSRRSRRSCGRCSRRPRGGWASH